MHPALWLVLGVSLPVVALAATPKRFSPPSTWAGAGCATGRASTVEPPCVSRYPLLGTRLDPALWSWQSPKGWRFAWLRDVPYLEAWSHQMDHDLVSFMAARPSTDFAFGIVDRDGAPKASFVLEWVSVPQSAGTWSIQFAQGRGAAAVDQATFEAIAAFGRWLGLDCIPLAG